MTLAKCAALFLFSQFLLIGHLVALAQSGVKGTVKNTKGELLSFASILAKGTTRGTIANEEGRYEFALEPGIYEIVFQFLGHKTVTRPVEIKENFLTLDVELEEQVVKLNEVRVSSSGEDPAYTIMRKAVAMARFHMLAVDAYTARTYVKGSGKVSGLSGLTKWLVGKKLEKETGLKVGQTYVLESINDISFARPNTVHEKVISNRSNFPPRLREASGNIIGFATVNFYQPKAFEGFISPLSPNAFAYYRFAYEGTFEDRGTQVNKIRVTPKSSGATVFSGTIFIIEDTWAIHSLDLTFASDQGKYEVKQLYAPFKEVWMPVYFDLGLEYDLLGIHFGGRYITNVRNYNITVNPQYQQKPEVVDEKVEKDEAKKLQSQKIDSKTALAQQQLTRKQLKKAINELEKQDTKQRKARREDVSIVNDYTIDVDTLAAKRSTDFWNTERQVPLTDFEVKGYVQADSINRAEAGRNRRDSLRNLPKFKPSHLLMGHTYNYGKREPIYGFQRRLSFTAPLSPDNLIGNFYNSVEGYYLNAGLRYSSENKLESRLDYTGNARYSFARHRLNGTLGASYLFHKLDNLVSLSAGRFVRQINGRDPITPFINTVYSLLLEENYLKLYERSFVNLTVNKWFSEQFSVLSNLEYALRSPLENNHFKPWIDQKDKAYSSNAPTYIESPDSYLGQHRTVLLNVALRIRPFAKAGRYNGRKYTINRNKPNFTLGGRTGLLAESRFSQLEFAYDQRWELEKLGDLRINAKIGAFLDKPKYLIDYHHFNGNQTILSTGNFDSFRNLDYYTYSTAQNYLEIHANNRFQQFLLTQIPVLRLAGFQEHVLLNYFNAFGQGNRYVEVGYGFTTGVSFLGLGAEVVSSFFNERYRSTVIRIRVPF